MSAHTEELDAKLIGAKLKEIAGPERRPMGVYSAEDVKDYWLRQAADRIEALVAELTAYTDAALYDAMMDGPRFKGWNRSQLDRARRITEARNLAQGV